MDRHISDMDWARLAMAIDCEGSINVSKITVRYAERFANYHHLAMTVYGTTPDLTDWIAQTFGATKAFRKRTSYMSNKPGYEARFTSKNKMNILLGIMPYAIVKRQQIELALRFLKTLNKWAILPKEIIEEREWIYNEMHRLNTG